MHDRWQTIKRWAQKIGDFQARLILTLLYGLLVLPTGLITQIGSDLLESRPTPQTQSFWKARPRLADAVRPARRQT